MCQFLFLISLFHGTATSAAELNGPTNTVIGLPLLPAYVKEAYFHQISIPYTWMTSSPNWENAKKDVTSSHALLPPSSMPTTWWFWRHLYGAWVLFSKFAESIVASGTFVSTLKSPKIFILENESTSLTPLRWMATRLNGWINGSTSESPSKVQKVLSAASKIESKSSTAAPTPSSG